MLIYDFDGVLMDSVHEVAVTAFNMLTGRTITHPDQIPPKAFQLFLKNRFQIQVIGDAPILMNWCLETADLKPDHLLNPKEYRDILERTAEPLTSRTTQFFETRKRFISKDMTSWLSLNRPFQPIWQQVAENHRKEPVILTNKNREAVLIQCRHFGFEISDDNVYSGDEGVTKIENMTCIMQRFAGANYVFIDDSVKNLREIDETFNREKDSVSLILATWGYTGPDDADIAKRLGYRPLAIEEFKGLLSANNAT